MEGDEVLRDAIEELQGKEHVVRKMMRLGVTDYPGVGPNPKHTPKPPT